MPIREYEMLDFMGNFTYVLYQWSPSQLSSQDNQIHWINSFMHNVVKWPNILLKFLIFKTTLKYVWPFYNIIHERVNRKKQISCLSVYLLFHSVSSKTLRNGIKNKKILQLVGIKPKTKYVLLIITTWLILGRFQWNQVLLVRI